MPITRPLVAALGLMTLTACEPQAPQPDWPLACDDSFQSLVGTNIGALSLPQGLPHRIITPGMAVTEEYSADRLNLHVDDKGRIISAECG